MKDPIDGVKQRHARSEEDRQAQDGVERQAGTGRAGG